MSAVKGEPKSSLRAERAQVTRTRIADAARTLFSTRGYGSTTLTAIASEAGVAVQTVYAVYGSKAGILRALREAVLRQPDAEALFEAAMRERDPDAQLHLFARSIRQRWEHGHDVVAIHQDAAATDPTLRHEVEGVLAIRRNGIGRLAASFQPALAPGVEAARATAILDALTLPEVYAELVDVQSWTPDEFEAWLVMTLRQQLLRRSVVRSASTRTLRH